MPFDPRLIIRTLGELSEGIFPVIGPTVDLIDFIVQARKSANERKLDAAIDNLSTDDLYKLALESGLPPDDKVLQELVRTYAKSVDDMERATEELDPELQEPARRVVEANFEYIEAEREAREALESGDTVAHAAAVRKLERIDREIQTFELMKGMHDAMKQSAGTLAEIKSARELADREQASQATFNKRMALVAIIVAAGSLGAAVVMPFVEHWVFPDQTTVIVQQPAGAPSTGVAAP